MQHLRAKRTMQCIPTSTTCVQVRDLAVIVEPFPSSLPRAPHPLALWLYLRTASPMPLCSPSPRPHRHLAPGEAFSLVLPATRVSHTFHVSQSSFKRGDAFRRKVTQIMSVLCLKLSMAFFALGIKFPLLSQPTDRVPGDAYSLAAPDQPRPAVSLPGLPYSHPAPAMGSPARGAPLNSCGCFSSRPCRSTLYPPGTVLRGHQTPWVKSDGSLLL